MQHSDDENNQPDLLEEKPGQVLSVVAGTLYLLNLLLLPGLAFIVLSGLYLRYHNHPVLLARCHLRQTFYASIWAGVMLVLVNGLILLLGGYNSSAVWIIVIIYFTIFHATFIFLGTFGLTRAMNGKHYHFPLIGRSCSKQIK